MGSRSLRFASFGSPYHMEGLVLMSIRNRVHPGEPLAVQADEYNAFLRLANQARNGSVLAEPRGPLRRLSKSLIRVKNVSGSDLDRYAPLKITGPVFLPSANLEEFKNRIVVNGDAPSAGDKDICVAVEPIAAGSVGAALAPGLIQCRVAINASTDEFVRISGSGVFESADSGIGKIVWKAGTSGTQWALVKLGALPTPAERIKFLVKGAVSSASTTFTVDGVQVVGPRGSSSPVSSSSAELTVHRYTAGYTIDDNSIGCAEWVDSLSGWYAYILDENCPE